MLKGQLSHETFSYRDSHRFTDSNYVLVVKDEEFPNNSLVSVFYNNNGKLLDIDEYEMGDRILATKNMLMDVPPLNERFSLHQLIKISSGTIIKNEKYHDGSTFPKSITFHTNVYALKENEIIEIFEGVVNEETAIFELNEIALNNLLKDYIQKNNSFFVLNNETLLGPFKIKNTDTSGNFIVEKSGWITFGYYEYTDQVFVEFEANHITRRIIVPSVAKLSIIQERDFITNSELMKKFETRLSRSPELYSVAEIEKVLDVTRKVMSSSLSENKDEEVRLRNILSRAEQGLLSNMDLANVIPEIPAAKREIENLELLKHNLIKEVQRFESIKLLNEQDLNAYRENLDRVKEEIKDIEKFKEEELKKQKVSLEDEITLLEEKRLNIDQEIEKERETKSIEIKELAGTIKYLEKTKESLTEGIQTLQENFTDEQKSAHKKLQELLVLNQHYNILSGREFDVRGDESYFQHKSHEIAENRDLQLDGFDLYKKIKDDLITILSKHNRKFDSHFIDNILISIHQSTLTLFAGMPGSGKTSLVRILMSALAPKERIREVSVGKGWTSQKDLIGFFNPISKKFHSSSTNVYSLLKQLDWERQQNLYDNSPMSYILLDEANLSPLEHYWSSFYNLTDNAANVTSGMKIFLGNSEVIEYANNLRFIGTINYDQTTEELSPRVIDRVNIIRMESQRSFDIAKLTGSEIDHLEISFSRLREIFGLLDYVNEVDISVDEDFEVRFTQIIKKFEDLRIFVSHRVQIAIRQYCKVAKTLMYEQNKPLDYCISQRLLPLIKVQGGRAKAKLKDLKVLLDDNKYDISSKILNDIISIGEEGEMFQDDFNYFLTLSHV